MLRRARGVIRVKIRKAAPRQLPLRKDEQPREMMRAEKRLRTRQRAKLRLVQPEMDDVRIKFLKPVMQLPADKAAVRLLRKRRRERGEFAFARRGLREIAQKLLRVAL